MKFQVMNAEKLTFTDNFFDVVFGVSILHHLELDSAFSQLRRVLIPGGKALFVEPLGHNPIINLYRRLTPDLRTEDEHPLLLRDLEHMTNYFKKVRISYFNFLTILAIPFRDRKYFSKLYKILTFLDKKLFNLKFFRLFAWQIVIELEN